MCEHPSRSVSATGDTYCLTCGKVLVPAQGDRPCGCVNDPLVFGHQCQDGRLRKITASYPV